MTIPTITPCLWFDGNVEDAVAFYTSIFPNSHILAVDRYGESTAALAGQRVGSVMAITFQLARQRFMALNGGPQFKFTPAISLAVECETQAEVDDLWTKLSAGGETLQCGWLTDRFGVTWQIVPSVLKEHLTHGDEDARERMMRAMLKMVKLDIAALERAFHGA